MRLFVAVDLDEASRAAAAGIARTLATRLPRSDTPSPVRWVPPEQLHLTLRFLGDLEEGQAASVRHVLGRPWETVAFTSSLTAADLFPLSGAPRVIWLSVDEGQAHMVALKREVDRRLALVGFEPETKPFRAHLTLGRVKRRASISSRALRAVLSGCEAETARWAVTRVTLYESRMSFRGATYHVVESAMLAPPREAPV